MSEELKTKDLEVLWTTGKVAQYFGVSIQTVHRWIRIGKIDKSKLVNFSKRIRIPRSEVERIAGVTKQKLNERLGGEDINH